jgi:protein-L-isoaspartate O-methyltransferase
MRSSFLGLFFVFAALAADQKQDVEVLAPYYETPEIVVDRMLQLGNLRPGEKMFDLGSGDGRIVIMSAQKYSADATGIELDGALVKQSTKRIKKAGLSANARIVQGDLLKQDYSSADLITVYLLPFGNERLTPVLEKQLKPGCRVVSHNAAFTTWTPVKVADIKSDGEGHSHRLYLYQR